MNPLREDEVEILALTDARNGVRLQMTSLHATECVTQVLRVGYPLKDPVVAQVRVQHTARTWEFALPVDSPRRLVLSDRLFPESVLYAASQQPERLTLTFMQVGALVEAENVARRARFAAQSDEQIKTHYFAQPEPRTDNESAQLFDELFERGWVYSTAAGAFERVLQHKST